MDDDSYLSTAAACKLIGVSRFTLIRAEKAGKLRAFHVGGSRKMKRYLRSEVLALLEPGPAPAPPAADPAPAPAPAPRRRPR